MNVIEVTDLTKIYDSGLRKGNVIALNKVSLQIQAGEIFGLLGPNGAGKTTLFKILLGIVRATSGESTMNGLPPSNPESRAKVGYLPENHRFPNHLTGLGLLESTGRLYGIPQAELDIRFDRLLHLVDMEKWADTKIRKYSKGMAQRIGLAQALIADPDILMLDEPTDGIDPVGKVEIREILLKLRSMGKTVIVNSHLLSEVEQAADRVAILSKGQVVRMGEVSELTSRQSQFEIEAEIGDHLFELDEAMGKVRLISSDRMTVELQDEKDINYVIDQLRFKKISIRSVKPVKITLEQSFFEAVRGKQEPVI
ncbi:MAG: ABC transporter ATP-binding protein [candidate division Zixibacteria bacterium]|nr:ABC transporter ATP-binding protein [candidate division Zixibacteria bacterium]